jgi:hypothetical protein
MSELAFAAELPEPVFDAPEPVFDAAVKVDTTSRVGAEKAVTVTAVPS